jgi:hypothetical protein
MSALEDLGNAVERALGEAPVSDVLTVLTGAFVALTVEVVRRGGHDSLKTITVDSKGQRDITIHAGKAPPSPKPWPELLPLVNDYATAMTDAAQHQAASKVDIAKSQAMKALGRLRTAIYGDEKSYGEVQR